MQRTFVMVKPDGIKRGLAGKVIDRLERKGYLLQGAKLITVSRELAEKHYQEHVTKPFFPDLVKFITSGPVLATVWTGSDVVAAVRTLMGATNPTQALPGSLRGDFANSIDENLVHGSDSVESAAREIALWFTPAELI
ncbi:MAG: hypothetical protein RLZ12_518 [Bacillota bacterium]|jgi:nucleoside-diphosphate kinase